LWIFIMMNGFQHIVNQKKTATIWVSMSSPCLLIGLVILNFTRKLMDFLP
jgi:hypothetical protein